MKIRTNPIRARSASEWIAGVTTLDPLAGASGSYVTIFLTGVNSTNPPSPGSSVGSVRDNPRDDHQHSQRGQEGGPDVAGMPGVAVAGPAVDGDRLQFQVRQRRARNQPTTSTFLPAKSPARSRPKSHSQIRSGWR